MLKTKLEFHRVSYNRAGGGATTDLMQLSVRGDSGPFLITQPNTAVTWTGGATQTVTWSVNNTNLPPVNCANVKISLSTDGGNTFPIVLAASTLNDGSENVAVPNLITTQARVKVEAVGNLFFDISDANFTVTPSGACPIVGSISQSIGNPGTSVVIMGANFSGVTAVKFANNVTASFTVNSNTQITATVPGGAVTGPIAISKTGCSDVQTGTFTVSSSPSSDLSADNNPGGFGCLAINGAPAYYVNRLTPMSYPATLTSASIYFINSPICGLTVGASLEVIVGVNLSHTAPAARSSLAGAQAASNPSSPTSMETPKLTSLIWFLLPEVRAPFMQFFCPAAITALPPGSRFLCRRDFPVLEILLLSATSTETEKLIPESGELRRVCGLSRRPRRTTRLLSSLSGDNSATFL